jgi:hypothetical protein
MTVQEGSQLPGHQDGRQGTNADPYEAIPQDAEPDWMAQGHCQEQDRTRSGQHRQPRFASGGIRRF